MKDGGRMEEGWRKIERGTRRETEERTKREMTKLSG